MSNVALFFWSYFLGDRKQVQKEKEKFVVCVHVFRKTSDEEISRFAYKSSSIFFLRARSASGRCFVFSAAKAGERAQSTLRKSRKSHVVVVLGRQRDRGTKKSLKSVLHVQNYCLLFS